MRRHHSLLSLLTLAALVLHTTAHPDPAPEARPEAAAAAAADAEAQYGNYAPFSGILYIVNADGTQANAASYGSCAAGCNGLGCCAAGYACAMAANNVACCPAGQQCQGVVAAAVQTVTVTVNNYVPTTVYNQPTNVVVAGVPVVYTTQNPGNIVYAGYCSTLIANGPGLPTTRAGDCGTILVVNGADRLFVTALEIFGISVVGPLVVAVHVLSIKIWR
ncbi:hypothetical protein H2199_008743 [Coniosporium tulheliwenetii]|uniref:Uncharacterized protein n=1 Tax=Coniosporium tulheliwenetii TaxID=3383036 RepID=A0ACC2YJ75_9PEZI|nr:hypothetical protein H2199_008743 [Cladosporium sp. JES 115]